MALKSKVAIEVVIKDIKKIADLKKGLKELRAEQKKQEARSKTGQKQSHANAKAYKERAAAIKFTSKQLRELNKDMAGANKSTKAVTKSSNGMAKQFIKAAAAIGIVVGAFRLVSRALSSVVSTFTEFEFVMAKVNAVSGATDTEFAKLTASAEDLGRKTFFTATQVGELQLAYSKLGFTSAEILLATKATLDLATSTGTDLARAAQVAGASIRGFQLDASEAGRVVDVMAVAFASSALDIEKWNTSMTKVAPIAAMAGFEIEEVAAIMGKLTDTGIEASIAGTSLRNIFLKMQDPTSDLSKTVGHTITNLDEMLIAFKGLQDAGTDLTDVLSFMDVRQVAAFGTMLKGSDDIATLRDSLLEASGEGERMADIVGDTLQGAFLKFKSAVQGVAIVVMKNFGEGMKDSIVNLSKWLNGLVKNEKAITKLADKVKKAAEWVGTITKVILAYVVGAKLAAMWTATTSSAFFTMMTGAQRAATGVRVLTVAVRTFTSALITTGVGALVVALGFLVSKMLEVKKVAETLPTILSRVNVAFKDNKVATEGLTKELESLAKTRKDMHELSTKEGKDLEKNSKKSYQYSKLKKDEKISIANINKVRKIHNKELVKENDNIKDIISSTNTLIESMNKKAYTAIYTSMRASILQAEVESELIEKAWQEQVAGWQDIDKVIKDVEDDLSLDWIPEVTITPQMRWDVNSKKRLENLLEDYGMTIAQFKDAVQGGSFDKKIEELEKTISSKLGGMSITDLMSGAESNKEEKPTKKSAIFEMNEIIKKHQDEVYKQRIEDEKDNQKALLAAAITGTQEYLDQYKGKEDKNKTQVLTGSIRMAELMRKQRKANNAQSLEDLRVQASRELTIAKEGLTMKVLSEFEYAEQVYLINKQLLEDEEKLLTEKEKLGKKSADIDAKKAALELNIIKARTTEKERLLKKEHDDKVLALELEQSTTMMNQIEFDNRMLVLEAEYLNKRAELHKGNALVLIDINNDILKNNIEVNKTQQEMMQEQISAMGGVGSALTNLAGDNEKLNFIKEAGNKISEVANILSAAMALQQNLITLGIIKGTAAKAADIAVEAGGMGVKAGSAILNQGGGDPYTALFRMIAMIALVSKVMGMWEKGGVIDDDKFARGGMVDGASHAQGGVKFAVGGRVHELEGGEAVINKRSTAMFRNELSSMNQAGGGVKFADGGLLNSPAFAQQQFSRTMGGGNGTQKVYVVEADISDSQRAVHVLEAEATI